MRVLIWWLNLTNSNNEKTVLAAPAAVTLYVQMYTSKCVAVRVALYL